MSHPLSEAGIVRKVAEAASQQVAHKTIRDLQRMKHTLSGDDSELKTTWDEICAQVQYEQSFHWDAYDLTVRQIVSRYVADLQSHERAAIWQQTDAGIDWECGDPKTREIDPVIGDEVIDRITNEYVYLEAGRWSNQRIREFIERSARRD